MSELNTEILAELVRAKRSCLVQLRDLGRRQLELIEEGDMSSLLDLLSRKQQFIVNLQRVERALDPFRGEDPEQRAWSSPQSRQRCAEEIQQCDALLSEILSQEKCSEGALVRRRDESAARLQGVHVASQARAAYSIAPPARIGCLDLTCDTER